MDDQQRRLFLALLLSAGAVFLMMYLFKPPLPPPDAETTSAPVAATETTQPVATPEDMDALTPDGTGDGTGSATAQLIAESTAPVVEALPPQTLKGTGFMAQFVNIGAGPDLIRIEEPEQYIPRDDFSIFPSGGETHRSFSVTLGGVPALNASSAFELVEDESVILEPGTSATDIAFGETPTLPTYSQIVYPWTDGQSISVDKIFRPDPERFYVGTLELVIRDMSGQGREIDHIDVQLWANATGSKAGGMLNPSANVIEPSCYVADALETEIPDDIQGQSFVGPAHWAGVQDRYFLTAVAAASDNLGLGCRFEADLPYVSSILRLDGVVVEPGGEVRIPLTTYNGPKSSESLNAAGSELIRSVDFGWFRFLAKPMHWILTTFHGFIPNWGLAIIFLTIVVKVLLFPFTHKSFKSMERMRTIQPELVKLREKYKNDKTKLTEETMKLYREHNVNPLGCLPMLLQMPIYIALYRMIYSSVEIYNADFALWIHDLSEPDPYYILPVLMAATMVGQQLLMPASVDNPQMKWVMRLMPVMFGFFMLVLPSGLVLYIFVSSLLGMLQQYYIMRQSKQQQQSATEEKPPPSSRQTRQQRRQAARRQD